MNAIEGWVIGMVAQPRVHAVLHALYVFLLPPFLRSHVHAHAAHAALAFYVLNNAESVIQSYVWFLLMGLVLYAMLTLRSRGIPSQDGFSYGILKREPGGKLSVRSAFQYLLPKSLYNHPSVRIDLMAFPISLVLYFFGLLSATVGVGVVQLWLLRHLGHSALAAPAGGFAVALEVVIILLARDFGRFLWHWLGHTVPFFWEFHKGHHSAEALHPFLVRTHPVDDFLRSAGIGGAGGLIGGTLIYALGMNVSAAALSWVASLAAVFDMLQWFEHSHVPLSFGKVLNHIFYAPYMHHIHHGARPEHMNKNLGITGGLILWDWLFGTLYWPQPGERIVWGASMRELGENNPHRTLWGFLAGPFIGAFQVLRGHNPAAGTGAASTPMPGPG